MTATPFYITTAISYPNGNPHIGHAYETIAADVLARFKRLDGFDVRFMTGTDEHGQKMQTTAEKLGKTAKELADENSARFKAMNDALNISYDRFIRTTDPDHYTASQAIWKRMEENGDIYLDKYAGWYSVRDEAYYAEDETEVRDGQRYAITTGTEVEWTEEESYFFRLSKYGDKLLELYANEGYVYPESRRNELISFVKGGLNDLSISRTTFDWGVPVPGNDKHVMYVWVDALTNYLTGLGYPDTNNELFTKYWPADLHLIGKDITRFHSIYWPAFLWSAGIELPKRVFGHGFLLVNGEKMSKSVGNVVDPANLVDAFGLDAVRFFLMREVSFGQDGSYSEESIINRINSDLANNLGNLAQRPCPWSPRTAVAPSPPTANSPKPTARSSTRRQPLRARPCRLRRAGIPPRFGTHLDRPRRHQRLLRRTGTLDPAQERRTRPHEHRAVRNPRGRAPGCPAAAARHARLDRQAADPARRTRRRRTPVRSPRHRTRARHRTARTRTGVPPLRSTQGITVA